MKISIHIKTCFTAFFVIFFSSTAAQGHEPPIVGDPEDATWKIYTNTSHVQCMTLSHDGNTLWVGTNGGLEQRDAETGQLIRLFTKLDGLPDNDVRSLLSDGNGGIWIGTGGGLAHLSDDEKWRVYNTKNSGLPSNYVQSLLSDGNNGIWIGAATQWSHGVGLGLVRFCNDGTWTAYDTNNSGLPDNDINSLLSDDNGGIWVGTFYGLAHISNDGTWTVYDKDNSGLPSDYVRSLLLDGNGGIWIGTTDDGLAHLSDDGKWEVYTQSNSKMPGNSISALLSDGNGGIWIGTEGSGLAHLTFGRKTEIIQNIEDNTVKEEIREGSRAAIIIAAGSTSPRHNKFWYATEYLTSQVIYSMFYNRGYDHSELYYLSPKAWADFNGDGRGDDIVNAPVTAAQLGKGEKERDLTVEDVRKAFEWAKSKGTLTQPFFLYFVDHGQPGKLMLTRFDALEGETLAAMMDDYQQATGNQVVVILEACYSGSLIPFLSGPDRVIIASSRGYETSIYDQRGLISFSAALYKNIAGSSLKQAFDYARETIKYDYGFSGVTPQLDDNGDGVADDLDGFFLADRIGINGTWGEQDASLAIEAMGRNTSVNTGEGLTLEARVNATGAVKKVWAVVRPPNPQVEYDELGTPIMRNPTFTLSDNDGDGTYSGQFSQFPCAGDYTVSFFVNDYKNNAAVSSAITVTAQGGEACPAPDTDNNPPDPHENKVTTAIYASRDIYYSGDTITIEVKNEGTGFFDQYTALGIPGGTLLFITEENRFTPDILPWSSTPRMDNIPVRIMSLPLLFEIPKGTYWAYNLLVPAGANIFEVTDQWIFESTSFTVE
ncbi:MAG: hypothetical protein HQK66_01890 [Desulfamplus sp.]|nr:hypothetical protein [Desulfamplus sp.]